MPWPKDICHAEPWRHESARQMSKPITKSITGQTEELSDFSRLSTHHWMNDIDMENHPTKSKWKKNEGQRKRSLLATKSSQDPLLQRDKYGYGTCFFCVKASVVTLSKGSASLHSKNTISPSCIPQD